VPASGPPPGFADRKPIRPQTPRFTPRVPGPGEPPPFDAPLATPKETPAVSPEPKPALQSPPSGSLLGLFDPEPSAGAEPPPPPGPPWPSVPSSAAAKAAAMQLLKDKSVPDDTPPGVAASARKLVGMLGSAERASLEKAGPESPFADALGARVALETATSEGVRLASSKAAAVVDSANVSAVIKVADDAGGRLQKEANAAIGKGEVESLQLITSASAALSRDLLNFKETADRLRGLAAAPRLSAGALDPDFVLPGQQPRAKSATSPAPAQLKTELRDFQGLEERPGNWKRIVAVVIVLASVALAANAFYFSVPQHSEVTASEAGKGVSRIDVTGGSAIVTITPDWLEATEINTAKLVQVLRERGVKKAILMLPSGSAAGIVDVASGKASGLPKVAPKPQ
jgi:hypothetical protein